MTLTGKELYASSHSYLLLEFGVELVDADYLFGVRGQALNIEYYAWI